MPPTKEKSMNLLPTLFRSPRIARPYLRGRLDDMFDVFTRDFGALDESMSTFKIDVKETDAEYIVKADLPGVQKNNISLNLTNQLLSISVEQTAQEEEKEADYILRERSYQSCYRTIPLALAGTQENVKADFKDGVLEIHVKKAPEKQSKRIPIS